jgi:hypothetical protein
LLVETDSSSKVNVSDLSSPGNRHTSCLSVGLFITNFVGLKVGMLVLELLSNVDSSVGSALVGGPGDTV